MDGYTVRRRRRPGPRGGDRQVSADREPLQVCRVRGCLTW
ncbi:hypothetical protein GT025_19930 [Streptomyces sp. SID4920]|nr:hypothetical protein [Streptomyces sp. SID4920]MYX64176.1 hypothetical protein [Streptomyces sp. SID8373]